MADLIDAVRIHKPDTPSELNDIYFPKKQEVCGPNGGSIPVDIGSATVNLNGDVVAEFDGVEEALGTPADAAASSDSATSGLVGLMKRLLGKTPTLVTGRVPVDGSGVTQPVSGTVTAAGFGVITTASFTRPSDTTAYAAQDIVCNSTSAPVVLTFSGAGRANGGSGIILAARHLKSSTTTTGATYRLHLYKVAPTAINDNAPFTLLYANRANRIGFIDFSHAAAGTGSDATNALTTFANLPFVCDSAASALYGLLVVTSAYTPTSGEQHFIELSIAQN
jgi:hypothetical protein